MSAEEPTQWLMFLPQLPSTPSSLRVTVWRRMREAGAVGWQNGVWILPYTERYEQIVRELLHAVEQQQGSGIILRVAPLDPGANATIRARFRDDRDQEYREFADRGQGFLDELAKETHSENFSFAELEENEQDFHRLTGWLRRIKARDLLGSRQAEEAARTLDRCARELETFTRAVYAREGLAPDERGANEQ